MHFLDKMTEALSNINHVIVDNRSTLDSIQDMAVELTRSVQVLEKASVNDPPGGWCAGTGHPDHAKHSAIAEEAAGTGCQN